MKDNVPSLRLNFGMNALLTVSSVIFPIITFPYVSRILLPEGTGKVSFAVSLISYFTMLSQLGIPTYGIRACARVRDDREKLTKVTQELVLINLIMSIISYAIFFMMLVFVPKLRSDKTLFLIVSCSVILNAVGMEWLYKGLEQYTFITIRSIIFKVLSIAVMFLFIHKKEDYLIYAFLIVFSGYVPGIVNFIRASEFIDLKPLKSYELKKHLKPVLIFFAMSCATIIYTNLDTVMLGFMKTDTDVGYYNAAIKIKTVLVSLVTSLGAVLLPRASYYIEQGEFSRFKDISKKALRFVLSCSIPLMVYFILFSKESILFISGGAYMGSVVPMMIIMPTLLFIGITNIIGIQIFIPLGKEKTVLYSEITGAIVDVIINLLLIPKYGAAGAAAGTVLAEAAVLLFQVFALLAYEKEKNPAFSMASFLIKLKVLYIVPAVILCAFLSYWVKAMNLNSFLTLAISSCLFFGIYGIIFWNQWKNEIRLR